MKDERLAKRAADGDERALAAIYERYHQDLYRFCLAITRDPQDAQDALQNTMVKMLRALPGETRRIQLKPWLYRIAHNEAVEVLRRRRDSAELDPELAALAGGPSESAETRQRLRELFDDLGQLPQRQRSALVMRELADLDFDQIGTALDTSGTGARQAVYEARVSLRQIEAGREMSCKKVMWELSEGDGRVARRREIQAHLRSCPECRAFRDEIAKRRDELAAIAPLPAAVSAGLLSGLLGGAGGGAGVGGGGAAGGAILSGVAFGGGKATALKVVATVAVVAAGATAADRGGLIETPLPARIGGEGPAKSAGTEPGGAVQPRAGLEPGGAAKTADPAEGVRGEALDAASKRQGPAAESGGGSAPASAERSPSGNAEGKAHGGSKDKPAAAEHGQQTAAEARSKKKPKGAKGNSASSKGAAKPATPAKGNPAHGTGAKPQAKGSPPPDPGAGKVTPDKAPAAPFQPPGPEMSKGASSSQGGANPSKEAR